MNRSAEGTEGAEEEKREIRQERKRKINLSTLITRLVLGDFIG
jgi:hypothetical protein